MDWNQAVGAASSYFGGVFQSIGGGDARWSSALSHLDIGNDSSSYFF